MTKIQKSGYLSKSLSSDLMLGVFDGLDNALWCYGFATILFAGAFTAFLPVGVAVILTGWGLLGLYVALTSRHKIHLISIDEQAVVILAAVGVMLAAHLGDAASGPSGLATMLALMSITSIMVLAAFVFVGHLRLARLLELLPFPVICGFMAGIGWLLLNAMVFVTVDVPISADLPDQLENANDRAKLLAALGCGVFLVLFMNGIKRAWAFPAAAMIIACGFYAVTTVLGLSNEELLARGWLFDVNSGVAPMATISGLSFSDIDFRFILGTMPELLTIVFLALLNASMSLTALSTTGQLDLDSSTEIENQGFGNILCAAVGCPPGYTDVAGSVLYEQFGASSRWMPLISSVVLILLAFTGSWLIGYFPKVLVGATILMFAYQLIVEWLFQRVRGFQPVDFLVVCIILAMVIFVGFMVGIVTGVVLTLVLFVLRYSMISAIHGQYTLRDYRSSVERPLAVNHVLDEHGFGSLVYTLRGFLFFGTANAILDRIKKDLGGPEREHHAVVMDFKRVTGMDISALNTFVQIKNYCESLNVKVLYSAVPIDTQMQITSLDAVSSDEGTPLFFDEVDYAVEFMENLILTRFSPESVSMGVRQHLEQILDNPKRIDLIMHALQRVDCKAGDALFLQGDQDNGFYVLETGSLSAYIDGQGYIRHRVKKFGPGSLIGELSMFMPTRQRTASVLADVDSVLYFMSTEVVHDMDLQDTRLAGAIHELIARALGMRINYMNQRLMLELD